MLPTVQKGCYEKICSSIKFIRLLSCNRGRTIYKERGGDEAVKLKDVGNVMLDFLKVPCFLSVNNVSWEKIECRNKIPRGIFFYPGKMVPLKKEL
jgi:hypothetical protein